MKDVKIFACPTAESFTKEICDCLGTNVGEVEFIKFKNDNNFVQYKETVRGKNVFIVQTVTPPVNERIMELLIAVDAAVRAAAKQVTVVLPYYPYSRSDKKDQPRVPITAKLVQQLLESSGATGVITCDLHNPAIQGFFNINCDRLTGKNLLQEYFMKMNNENMVVVATDAGSSKKAYKYSTYFCCPMALIDKRRSGNDDCAKAAHIIGDVKDKIAVIFDDEISTAGTLCEAAEIVHKFGAKEIYAGATHGVFCGEAIEKIKNSKINEVVVTNTIPVPEDKRIDKIKVLSIAPYFAEAIKRVNESIALGDLYDFYF